MSTYQKKINVGAFAKKNEDYKDGDTLVIANEGKKIVGQFGEQDVFLVKLPKGDEKNLTFNQTTINNMVDAFGNESKDWIGKNVKVWLILQNVQGKMTKVTYLSHPDAIVNDDGNFVIPSNEAKANNESPEDVDPNDIPF